MKKILISIIAYFIPLFILVVNFINPYHSNFFIVGLILQIGMAVFCLYVTMPSATTEKKYLNFSKENQSGKIRELCISAAIYIIFCAILIIGINLGIIRFILYIGLWVSGMVAAESSVAILWRADNLDFVMAEIEKDALEAEMLIKKQEEEKRIEAAKQAELLAQKQEKEKIKAAKKAERLAKKHEEERVKAEKEKEIIAELDGYVQELLRLRKGSNATSFFLGVNQPKNLMAIGEEIGEKYGIKGLEYVVNQLKNALQINHPYDGRELETAWESIWVRSKLNEESQVEEINSLNTPVPSKKIPKIAQKDDMDIDLLRSIKQGDPNIALAALQKALYNPTPGALAAVEKAIADMAGNPNVTFYKLGGQRIYTQKSMYDAKEQIEGLALSGNLLQDPAYTQSLMAGLINPGISTLIMNELAMVRPKALFEYQLLGIQMQLSQLVQKNI